MVYRIPARRAVPARRYRLYAGLIWLWHHTPALAGLGLVTYLIGVVLTHPFFEVREVTVSRANPASAGLSTLPALQRLTQVVGTNIFRVNTAQLEEDLGRIPSVQRVRVLTALPDRLIVEIIEREPKVIWRTSHGPLLVDEEGVIIATAEMLPGQPAGRPALLEILDQDQQGLAPGMTVDRRAITLAERLAVLLPAAGLPVKEFRYSARVGLVALTEPGVQVLFGFDGPAETRVSDLLTVLEVARRRGDQVRLVDVRPEGRPYYQPVATPTAAPSPTVTAGARQPARPSPTPARPAASPTPAR
jgi:cell division septal protein FtsQ